MSSNDQGGNRAMGGRNPGGRMMIGRGPGGRMMVQGRGRGGRMMVQGRGRGDRMMQGRGRGRHGGRMQVAGRHGAHNQGQNQGGGKQIVIRPHYLNTLNSYNTNRVLSYLTDDDLAILGKTYPKFNNIQKQRAWQKERMKKAAEQAHEARLKKGEFDTICMAKILEEEVNQKKKELSEDLKTDESVDDKQVKKRMEQAVKDNIANAGEGVSDPHTLLARLNTKRLYRRIKELRKINKDLELKEIYTVGMRTDKLAMHEWGVLVDAWKQEKEKATNDADKEAKDEEEKEKKNDGEEKEKEEEEEEEEGGGGMKKEMCRMSIPSSCELLTFSPCPRAVAVLASYPRSGNSLLRNLYEKLTLRVTGSDMRGGLTKHDMVGEAATETNLVQFVKTHFPERRGAPPFKVDRAVLLVRNPYDAMESYFNLMTTNTHTTSLSEEQRAKSAAAFAEMAKKEILVWRDFHQYWLNQQIPLMVIRYEDLIRETDKVMAKVISFVLEVRNMSFFEQRLDRCIREEQIERLGSYKPRSGGIGKSLSKYPPDLLQEINSGLYSTMRLFGYDEMLVPNPSEWKLEPLDQYGVYIPGRKNREPLVINGKAGLVRDARRHTDWRAVKRQMATKDQKVNYQCNCYKCVKERFDKMTIQDKK